MVRRTPDKSIAKMTRPPVESAKMTRPPVDNLMPSMSATFIMEENRRINSGSWSQPIIIDYKENNKAHMETNAVTPNNLNNGRESSKEVLRRL